MADISFYHLTRKPLEVALPELLEKIIERDMRAVVLATTEERVRHLNDHLWTYRRETFLPHGTASDGPAELQPIYLTATEQDVPNAASVLLLVDGADCAAFDGFDRVLDLFDGNDPESLAGARNRWRQRKQAGYDVTYWKQGERGWQQGG